jgi:hypothetical protein
MDKTEQLIQKTEFLLRQLDTLQTALQQLHGDLQSHSDDLNEQLGRLRKSPSSTPAPPHKLRPVTNRERRSAPRRKGNPISVQISNGSGNDAIQGWVLDRSSGGLRLLVDDPMTPGTVLSIRPAKVHENFPWVKVKVKNCHPERKSWNVGCQFVEKIAWDDLQHFG